MLSRKPFTGIFSRSLHIMLLCIISTCILTLSSCGGEKNNTLEQVQSEGVLRIGYANEPPYGYLDTDTNRVTGEAPEIARYVAKELGVEKVEGVLTDWGSLIPGLQSGRFDVVAAGMYITPKRAQAVDFSNPTYAIGEGFLVKAGNPKHLHSYEDVKKNKDVKLGIVSGTVEVGYARDLGIPDEQIVKFSSNLDAVDGVKTGRVDAFAGTSLTISDLVKKFGPDSGLEAASPFTDPIIDGNSIKGYGAFAFRKGDTELRKAFNGVLDDFIGSDEHLKLVEPFGFGKKQLPGDVTAAELSEVAD